MGTEAHGILALTYDQGDIGEKDTRKAAHHYQLAAMKGHVMSRRNLGCDEGAAGNIDRAYKHFVIAAGMGCETSMKEIRHGYAFSFVSKDDFAKTLHAYGNSVNETKSDQRDTAMSIKSQRKRTRERQRIITSLQL